MQCSIKREIRKQVAKGYLKMYIEEEKIFLDKHLSSIYSRNIISKII